MTPPDASPRRRRARPIDLVNRALLLGGWKVGPRLGPRTRGLLATAGSRVTMLRPGMGLRRWQGTITTALGFAPDRELTRAAVASYLRNYLETLALPGWSAAEVVGRVSIDPAHDAALHAAVAGPGAILALPHSGNWDLAGAWACATGLPVATVAEELAAPEFAAFLRYREGLGMRVYSHRDPLVLERLAEDLANHRMVCLLADRNVGRGGVEVGWPTPNGPVPVRVPAGPALLARRTGATLLPTATHFTPAGLHITVGDPVAHRDGDEGLAAMCSDVVGFFAAHVAAHPADWHVFQPFFDRARR